MALTHVAANLAGTHWNLKTLDGATVANDERPLSISFDENRINGYAGCNSFFGNYRHSDNSFHSKI
jgi:heat shock protein HslJ